MGSLLDLQSGENEALEEQAMDILMADRARQPMRLQQADWFSEEQMELRLSREVTNGIGCVGEYLGAYQSVGQQQGLYKRAYNPLINRRPTRRALMRPGMDPWRQLIWEETGSWWYHPGKFVYPGTGGTR